MRKFLTLTMCRLLNLFYAILFLDSFYELFLFVKLYMSKSLFSYLCAWNIFLKRLTIVIPFKFVIFYCFDKSIYIKIQKCDFWSDRQVTMYVTALLVNVLCIFLIMIREVNFRIPLIRIPVTFIPCVNYFLRYCTVLQNDYRFNR